MRSNDLAICSCAVRKPSDKPFTSEHFVKQEKRNLWELLTLLDHALPEQHLPIVEWYEEEADKADATLREGRYQKEAIQQATEDTRAAIGDTAIDHYLARREADGHEVET